MKRALSFVFTVIGLLVSLQLSAIPLYWVGGNGNWNDAANWSFDSGGAGGAGIPILNDDVFFDANSFTAPGQAVTIDGDVFVSDMNWTGVTNDPQLVGTNAFTVFIDGSLTFSPDMLHTFMGTYEFTSSDVGNTITSAGQTFLDEVLFRGLGDWTLQDPLTVNLAIQVLEGGFYSNNQPIEVFTFFSETELDRIIDLGTSTVTLRQRAVGNPALLRVGGSNLTWAGGDATFELRGTDTFIDLRGDADFDFGNITFFSDNGRITSATSTPPVIGALQFQNNGELNGNHVINTWTLTMGQTVFLNNGSRQVVDNIVTGDDCDGLASLIVRNNAGANATLEFTFAPSSLAGLFLKGIEADSPDGRTILLFASQDGGNNGNLWQFQNLRSRNLYWVGGTGDWNDRQNWSTSSGGPGGACIPKPNDNIFFDNNSFTAPSDVVSGITPAFANNFNFNAPMWSGVTIDIPELYINNDLTLTSLVNWNIPNVYLVGNDEGGMSSNTDFQVLSTGPNTLQNLISQSSRKIILDSDLMLSGLLSISAAMNVTFDTNGFAVSAQTIEAIDNLVSLIFDGSIITITGPRMGLVMPLTIFNVSSVSSTGATFVFAAEDSGIEAGGGDFGNLIFEGQTGLAVLVTRDQFTSSSITFMGDGQLSGSMMTTEIINLAPAHDYIFDNNVTFSVSDSINAPGNICSPINITSNTNGLRATIDFQNSAVFVGEFVGIRDIAITDSNTAVFAGLGSADRGNNTGWTFPSNEQNEGVQQFLGSDIIACDDETIILAPFQAGDITRIIWLNDGSENLEFQVPFTAAEVIATAFFADGCSLSDTVGVQFLPAITINLGQDTTICEGESITIGESITGASYSWSTGETTDLITPLVTGDYVVTVSRGNCADIDSVRVSVIDIEDFTLGPDTTLCEGTPITFSAPAITSGSYTWSDGSSAASLTVTTDEVVWVEVAQDRCSLRDSVAVSFDPDFVLTLGNDTTICEGQSIVLSPLQGLDDYNWSDGSGVSTLIVDTEDSYSLTASRGVCENTAAVQINVSVIAPFSLGQDITQCQGDSTILTVPTGIVLPTVWSDGTSGSTLTINTSGTYWLEVQEATCTRRDSVEAFYEESFTLDLGQDTTLCEGESITIGQPIMGASYSWNTGETSDIIAPMTTGDYVVTVSRGTCGDVDSVSVSFIDIEDFTLGPDTILCEGTPITFSAPAITTGSFTWSDGSTAPSLTVTTDDVIWVEVAQDRCSLRDSVTISYDSDFELTLGNDTTICEGQSLVLSPTQGLDEYNWSDGSAISTLIVDTEDMYSLTASRGACENTAAVQVNVSVIAPFSIGQDITQCLGDSTTLTIPTGVSLPSVWSDGTSGSSLTINTSGTYWLEVQEGICTRRDSIEAVYEVPFDLDLGNDTTLCENQTLNLTTPYTDGAFTWSDNTSAQDFLIDQEGTYALELTRGACTVSDTITATYVIIPPVELGIDTTLCEGLSLELTATQVDGAQILWQDGVTDNTRTITTPGIYFAQVSLDICSTGGGITVGFDPALNLDLGADQTACEGDIIPVDASVINADNYSWSTGSNADNITIDATGNYVLTASRGECTEVDTITVTYLNLDALDLGEDRVIACGGDIISLDATLPGIMNYVWTELNSGATVGSDPMIDVTTNGIYTVTASSQGCSTADTITYAFDTPIEFTGLGNDTTICQGETLSFSYVLNDVNITWSDNSTGSDFAIDQAGTFGVFMERGGCQASDSIDVSVRPLPMVNLPDTERQCAGTPLRLNANTANVTYNWSTGATTSMIDVAASGTYVVTLTGAQCSSIDSTVVTFVDGPSFQLRPDTTICAGTTIILDPGISTQEGLMYRWSTGQLTPTIDVTDADEYRVTVTNIDNCSTRDTFDLAVNRTPQFQLPETSFACEGEAAQLTVIVTSDDFVWSTGETTPRVDITTSSIVWAEASIGTCIYRDSTLVTIRPIPVVSLVDDTAICEGDILSIDATTTGATYQWSTGETTPIIGATTSGRYSVEVTVDGCSSSDEVSLTVNPRPNIDLGEDRRLCEGETIALDASGAWTTMWSTGETTPTISVGQTGLISVTADLNGCTTEDQVNIDVQALPAFDLGEDISRCEQFATTLVVDRSDVDVIWSTGEVGTSIEVSTAGTYRASAMTARGCEFEDEVTIIDRECRRFSIYVPNAVAPESQGENRLFYVSPSQNADIFEYDLQVFDRWGTLLYQTADINAEWDARTPGYAVQPGVYTYAIKVRYSDDFESDRTQLYSGSFTIIR